MEPYYLPGFSFLLVEASFSILIGSGQGNLTDPQQASCALSASQLPNIAIAVHHRYHLLDHHLKAWSWSQSRLLLQLTMPSWCRDLKRLFSSLHTVHRLWTHTRPVNWKLVKIKNRKEQIITWWSCFRRACCHFIISKYKYQDLTLESTLTSQSESSTTP